MVPPLPPPRTVGCRKPNGKKLTERGVPPPSPPPRKVSVPGFFEPFPKFMPVHHIPGPDLLTYFKDELVDVLVRHWQQMKWTSCQCEVHSPWTQICSGQKACSKNKSIFVTHFKNMLQGLFCFQSIFLFCTSWKPLNKKKR